ncbi:MAG: phage tail assembly protein [Desulfocurvibacter africanus]
MHKSETRTIGLAHPIQVKGGEIREVGLRMSRKVRDNLAAARLARDTYGRDHGTAESEVCLFSILTDLPVEAIEELDMEDYGKLQEAYLGAGFTPARTSYGAGSSPSDAMQAGD